MSRTGSPDLAERGRRVLMLEAEAIQRVAQELGASFGHAVELLAAAKGRVIVSGVGKSGLIARKIAATFTSTGPPATFVHPVDSRHGVLGIVGRDDVALLLSKSGESDELFGLVEQLKRLGVPVIAMTGAPPSALARPASGALAVTLLDVKGFRREDFAALHPSGALGRRLLLRVADVMLQGDLPLLSSDRPMRDCVLLLAKKRGTVAVVGKAGELEGVVTAGDLTRLMERSDRFLDVPVGEVMTRSPKSTTRDVLATEAVSMMERHGIMALPVLDGGQKVIGMVHLHDLMRAGA